MRLVVEYGNGRPSQLFQLPPCSHLNHLMAMADDKKNTGPADDKRVNVHEDYEVAYWTKKFGCTKAQLVTAVEAVGVIATDVQKYLSR